MNFTSLESTANARLGRGRAPWSLFVAIAGVLAVLAAIFFAQPAKADNLIPEAGTSNGVGTCFRGELSVTSGAQILSSSLICPAADPSVIYEVTFALHPNSGGSGGAVLYHEINYEGVTASVPNGTGLTPEELPLNSGTALAESNEYSFAIAGERYDQAGNLLSHNFSVVGTTPKIKYISVRRREAR